MLAWHFTHRNNLDSILSSGLTAGDGRNWNHKFIRNNARGRLFFVDANNLTQIRFWETDLKKKHGDSMIIIEFEIPDTCKIYKDSKKNNGYYCLAAILPNALRALPAR